MSPYSCTRVATVVRGACGVLAKLALLVTILAVLLSRINPPAPSARASATAPLILGPETIPDLTPPKTVVFDPETGKMDPLASRVGMDLSHASGSPWRDERGRTQIVGVLSGLLQGGATEPTLVRASLPDGSLLDQLAMEILPAGRPCWFPDRSARILYVDSRSNLARLEFEGRPNRRSELRPTPVRWGDDVLGSDGLFRGDLFWPSDPRLKGRILASLSPRSTFGGVAHLERDQIWWLELNPEYTKIVAAGRLTRPNVPDDGLTTERCPTIGTDRSGRLLLAYLDRRSSEPRSQWTLKVAPIELEADSGVPSVVTAESRTICKQCVATPPSFSLDNRWLRYLTWPKAPGPWQVQRFALQDPPKGPNSSPHNPSPATARASAESVADYF
ncbi:hypothetical protein ACYOEI_01010 [Singulisphaera rosea]